LLQWQVNTDFSDWYHWQRMFFMYQQIHYCTKEHIVELITLYIDWSLILKQVY